MYVCMYVCSVYSAVGDIYCMYSNATCMYVLSSFDILSTIKDSYVCMYA